MGVHIQCKHWLNMNLHFYVLFILLGYAVARKGARNLIETENDVGKRSVKLIKTGENLNIEEKRNEGKRKTKIGKEAENQTLSSKPDVYYLRMVKVLKGKDYAKEMDEYKDAYSYEYVYEEVPDFAPSPIVYPKDPWPEKELKCNCMGYKSLRPLSVRSSCLGQTGYTCKNCLRC